MHRGTISDWAVALGTLALACATFWVARAAVKTLEQNKLLVDETHRLVEGNKILIENEERHHQENLRPLCVLEPTEPKIGNVGTNMFADVDSYSTTRDIGITYLSAKIFNKGNGPAVNVRIRFYANPATGPCISTIGTIASGQNYCIYNGNRALVPMKIYANPVDVNNVLKIIKSDWIICLTFEDIFGNQFYSIHKNDPDNIFMEFGNGAESCCQKINKSLR